MATTRRKLTIMRTTTFNNDDIANDNDNNIYNENDNDNNNVIDDDNG